MSTATAFLAHRKLQQLQKQANAGGFDWSQLPPELIGAMGGAGIGALGGLVSGDNVLRKALIGAGIGGAAGFGYRHLNQPGSTTDQITRQLGYDPYAGRDPEPGQQANYLPEAWDRQFNRDPYDMMPDPYATSPMPAAPKQKEIYDPRAASAQMLPGYYNTL